MTGQHCVDCCHEGHVVLPGVLSLPPIGKLPRGRSTDSLKIDSTHGPMISLPG
jgi:hypothetical protein